MMCRSITNFRHRLNLYFRLTVNLDSNVSRVNATIDYIPLINDATNRLVISKTKNKLLKNLKNIFFKAKL